MDGLKNYKMGKNYLKIGKEFENGKVEKLKN